MAIRNIVKEGDDVLRKNCRTVVDFNERLWTLLDDMAETMYDANGVGLAAPQVGVLRRVVVIDVGDGLMELINPAIVKTAGMQEGSEGCLSSPGEYGVVRRPMKVRVKAQDRYGKVFEAEGTGLLARAFCHEIDHLHGILFTSHVSSMLTQEELESGSYSDEE